MNLNDFYETKNVGRGGVGENPLNLSPSFSSSVSFCLRLTCGPRRMQPVCVYRLCLPLIVINQQMTERAEEEPCLKTEIRRRRRRGRRTPTAANRTNCFAFTTQQYGGLLKHQSNVCRHTGRLCLCVFQPHPKQSKNLVATVREMICFNGPQIS